MDTLKIILLAVICFVQVRSDAACDEPGYVKCRNNDRCVRVRYICDGDNDCGDMSDEEDELCEFQRSIQGNCNRRDFRCGSEGYCEGFENFCSCEERKHEHPKWCQMIENDGHILRFSDVRLRGDVNVSSNGFDEAARLANIFKEKLDSTIRSDDCPQFFTKVGDQCMSFFHFSKMNWAEGLVFCELVGGHLLTLQNDINEFFSVVTHIQELNVTDDFWIGGSKIKDSSDWKWLDNTDVPSGTPYWSIRLDNSCPDDSRVDVAHGQENCYIQTPEDPVNGHCLALTNSKFYYFSDERCLKKKGVICVHD